MSGRKARSKSPSRRTLTMPRRMNNKETTSSSQSTQLPPEYKKDTMNEQVTILDDILFCFLFFVVVLTGPLLIVQIALALKPLLNFIFVQDTSSLLSSSRCSN